MSVFVIFPNQLYENIKIFKNYDKVFLIEEAIYFYDPIYKLFKPNKIKIAYLRACMKYYYNILKNNNINIYYIEYFDTLKSYKFLDEFNKISIYDPTDHDLTKKLEKYLKNKELTIIESPNFLFTIEQLTLYYNTVKTPRHASFYEFAKNKLNILDGIKNMDKLNRNPPPKTEPNIYKYLPNKNLICYYDEAIAYTEKNFSKHYGNTKNVKLYPITSIESYKAFDKFLMHSLDKYGIYQDAIMKEDVFMYHSIISPMLNIGLLCPKKILDKTLKYYEANKNKIPLSSLEGFVRQLIGWREFERSLYMFKYDEIIESNLPNNTKKFKDIKIWYNGTTGILPIDNEIKKAVNYGYSHHIVRLMIFMNFFILCELDPAEIYKWFMEIISIDAYSWVMISNIYTMSYYYPKAMTKPYLSTSNYILKMSNYKVDGIWDTTWNALFHEFVKNKPSAYTFFYKRNYVKNLEFTKISNNFKNKFFKS
jgi:deoxyribodipyrimidine photolyase-related protein